MLRSSVVRATVATLLLLGMVSTAQVLLAPASAAPAPTLSRSTIDVRERFTVSDADCLSPDPWNPARVGVISGASSGGRTVAEDGTWSVTVDVGAHLGPGRYPARAFCSPPGSGGFDYPTVTVTVAGTPVKPRWETPPPPRRVHARRSGLPARRSIDGASEHNGPNDGTAGHDTERRTGCTDRTGRALGGAVLVFGAGGGLLAHRRRAAGKGSPGRGRRSRFRRRRRRSPSRSRR